MGYYKLWLRAIKPVNRKASTKGFYTMVNAQNVTVNAPVILASGVSYVTNANGTTTASFNGASVTLQTAIFNLLINLPASLQVGHNGPSGSVQNLALKTAMQRCLPPQQLTTSGAAALIERFTPGFVGYRGVPLLCKHNVGRNVFYTQHASGAISAPMVTHKNSPNSGKASHVNAIAPIIEPK